MTASDVELLDVVDRAEPRSRRQVDRVPAEAGGWSSEDGSTRTRRNWRQPVAQRWCLPCTTDDEPRYTGTVRGDRARQASRGGYTACGDGHDPSSLGAEVDPYLGSDLRRQPARTS